MYKYAILHANTGVFFCVAVVMSYVKREIMDYSLKKLDGNSVNVLIDQWSGQLDKILTTTEASWLESVYDQRLSWFGKVCSENVENSFYALVSTDGKYRAVTEITDASKGKDPSIKFLNVYAEPNLNVEWMDSVASETIHDGSEVMLSAITGAARLALETGVNKLKVYGRTDEMLGMFDALLMAHNVSESDGIKLFRQAKWLVIEMERKP